MATLLGLDLMPQPLFSNLRQVLLLGVAERSVMGGYFLLCVCKLGLD